MNGYMDILDHRKAYKSWVKRSFLKRDDLILDNVMENARVLNFGCGADTLKFLKSKSCSVVNFDIDVNNKIADYHNLTDIPGHFDAVILKEVVEHLSVSEMSNVFISLSQIANSIILTTPNVFDEASRTWFEQDITHVRPYNTSDIEGVLKHCGYPVVSAYVCEHIKAPHRNLLAKLNTTLPYASLVVIGRRVL